MSLLGRRAETEEIDGLLTEALAGRSRVLVLRGEAGVGKSALLDYAADRLDGFRVAKAVGVESEMELPYSGLHQLCAPMLDRLDALPVPQREALSVVFGLSSGSPPDRFLVGLATLTLVAELAEAQPLLCLVDDAQWLDRASAQVLGFVARRLLAEPIALVCAARTDSGDDVLAGLPELALGGLADSDARALLLDNVRGPLDAAVCEQIVAESHGNPLALLELPRTWDAAGLAGGYALPDGHAVVGKIEQSYARRIDLLPADTRLLVLTAAAEPLGDPMLLRRAATSLGVEIDAAEAAVDAGLLQLGGRVEFAHPLVRSAAYGSAPADERHRVHRALADATDARTDPDRRAWHRARAASVPDENVAAELERSAGRAQARGGLAAAAEFLHRAVALTAEPSRRSERALAAAQTSIQAGAFDAAHVLLATAEAGPLDLSQRARLELLEARLAFSSHLAGDAPGLLVKAATRILPFDVELARETYLVAWASAGFAGGPARRGRVDEIGRAIRALPRPTDEPHPLQLLLDGLAQLSLDGYAAAVPSVRRAADVLESISVDDVLRWGFLAPTACLLLWDFDGFDAIAARQVRLVRDAGALTNLPFHLAHVGIACYWLGDMSGLELVAEAERAAVADGTPIAPYTLLRLRALQGREAEASATIARAHELAAIDGQGVAANHAHWAAAVLFNGLARYGEAATAARNATANGGDPFPSMWAWPELVEAAARGGDTELAREAAARVTETTRPSGNDSALGIEARCRALVSDGGDAEDLYREAIERLARTQLRPDIARTHLVYGEWLRREGRRREAREQLHTAHDLFAAIGMAAFNERAHRELIASGERVRKRTADTRDELTQQEEQIARLAREGLSNSEIGAQLFISGRTVEWHLRNIFTKLGISSRRHLRAAIAESSSEPRSSRVAG
jgi:DNA-binding CsgD family transcriptional regulator